MFGGRPRGVDGGLDAVFVGKIAYQRCVQCGNEGEYVDGRCLDHAGGGWCIIKPKRALVVPGKYRPEEFWRCPGSNPPHYFVATILRCPLCRKSLKPKAKTSTLLVRQ